MTARDDYHTFDDTALYPMQFSFLILFFFMQTYLRVNLFDYFIFYRSIKHIN